MAQDDDSGEKTEDPTPRKEEEAREKGQVPFSTEFVAAASLSMALGLYYMTSEPIAEIIGDCIRRFVGFAGVLGTGDIDIAAADQLMHDAADSTMEAIMLFAGPLLILSILVGYGQVGFHISPKAVEFDLTKLNPVKGLQRMFSMRSVVRTGMAILKVVFIAGAVSMTGYYGLGELSIIEGTSLGPAMLVANGIFIRSVISALVVIFILGLIDFAYQRFQHTKDLKMSKQEIKQENKNSEGDPHIKARIRKVQQEMASRRMMDEVPEASVVITNPTHYAVALTYDRTALDGGAPRVVAKGVDHVAQNIKHVAREAGVVCFENVPLARALHAQCDIGDVIPEDLFEAVASVLAYVYGLKPEAVPA